METIRRSLKLKLPPGQSAFLWGPRKTGKSTYLKQHFPQSVTFDLLQSDLFLDFSKNPGLLGQRLEAVDRHRLKHPVILDEVQKVPALLDEVHRLIESRRLSFVLCGSSARKLRRGHANLLGGRAWRYEMFPLTTQEIGDPALVKMLVQGAVPSHYLQGADGAARSLKAYVQDYLKEEVFAEGLARNVPAFSRFFEAMGYSQGELVNYANIARDCGVDGKTVKEYFQILVDTLLGTLVEPYKRRQSRQVIAKAPKFYLFDVGVAGHLAGWMIRQPRGEAFGRALEQLVFMELNAHRGYSGKDYPIRFWRTKSGLEVDFVLGDGEVAIEVKGSARVDAAGLRGINAFVEEFHPRRALVVTHEAAERKSGALHFMPWRLFFQALWAGKIL